MRRVAAWRRACFVRLVLTVNFSPWSPYSGGGQRSTHNLACALSRRGHEVTVVYTKAVTERIEPPEPVPYAIAWAAFAGLHSRRQAPLRPLNAITVAATVGRLARGGAVDAVHGNGEEAALVGDLPRRRFRFVMTPRFPDYPPSMLRPAGPDAKERVRLGLLHAKYLVLGRALRAADWVVPTSSSARAMVRRAYGIDPARLRVVPNGIDDAFVAARRRADAKDGPVVFFGRLAPGKGVDTLLDASARTKQLASDGELAPEDLSLELARELAGVTPWGQGFPEPRFDGVFVIEDRRVVGTHHARLVLRPPQAETTVSAIAFGAAEEPWFRDAARIHALYKLGVNDYGGLETVQLVIDHARPL